MRKVYFVARPPQDSSGGVIVDLSESGGGRDTGPGRQGIDLYPVYAAHAASWRQRFVEWLGSVNAANASLQWWAYATTAKNFLSSPLGNELFQSLALASVIEAGEFDSLYVTGAAQSQVDYLRRRFKGSPGVTLVSRRPYAAPALRVLALLPRLAFHAGRIWLSALLRPRGLAAPRPASGTWIFTYFEAEPDERVDAFFGELAALIEKHRPGQGVAFTGFMRSGFGATLRRLARISTRRCWPLLLEARLGDVLWACARSFAALRTRRYELGAAFDGAEPPEPLLREALRADVTGGAFFYHLVIYRAAIRFGAKFRPSHLIYPFENKSLEKMLLLGLRRSCPGIRVSGYQHTSVTPRHTTFLFARGEASLTPLPDRIVTVGAITRNYLEANGNYPPGIFRTGCALRQARHEAAPAAYRSGGTPKILLALSSSTTELIRAVQFFRALRALTGAFELGIRPHPEFPLARLPRELADWARGNARDFSGTRLADNIAWCDLTAYVSSTVALETLMAGKPVVNFHINEVLPSDPVLGDPPLRWRVENPGGFVRVLNEIAAMNPAEFKSQSAAARAYVDDYLRPVSGECVACFLGDETPR